MSNTVADARLRAYRQQKVEAQASRLSQVIRESHAPMEWRLALVDLAILRGQLPASLDVHRVSLFHTTKEQ